jgi:hypothetical protein
VGATLRLIRAPDDPITVWPLFAELVRRHDISREECIVYGVIVAIARTGNVVTREAVRSTMCGAPPHRNGKLSERNLKRRLARLVECGLVHRRRHPGFASHYVPIGPQ